MASVAAKFMFITLLFWLFAWLFVYPFIRLFSFQFFYFHTRTHTDNSSSTFCILPHFCHISLNTLLLVTFRFYFIFHFCGIHFFHFCPKTCSPSHYKIINSSQAPTNTRRHTKSLLFSSNSQQTVSFWLLWLLYGSSVAVAFGWFELLVLIYHPFTKTALTADANDRTEIWHIHTYIQTSM